MMKKKINKILFAMTTAVYILGTAGCRNGETPDVSTTAVTAAASETEVSVHEEMPDVRQLAEVFVSKAETIYSCEQEINTDLDMDITVYGETRNLSFTTRTLSQTTKEPFVMKATSSVDMADEEGNPLSITQEMYTEKTGDGLLTLYSQSGEDENAEWTKTVIEMPENTTDLLDVQLFKSIVEGKTEAVMSPETETAEGKECFVVDTYLTVEETEEAMSNAASILSQMGIPTDLYPEDMFKDLSVPTKVWIDVQTGLPVKTEQDLTEALNRIMEKLINTLIDNEAAAQALTDGTAQTEEAADGDTAAESAAQTVPDVSMKINRYSTEVIFRGYNEFEQIVIPENVRGAKTADLYYAQ